jgi:hypothetical protein
MRNGKSDFETIIEFRINGSNPTKLHMEHYPKSVDDVIEFLSTVDTSTHELFKTLFNSPRS